jgi:hypothetical protein
MGNSTSTTFANRRQPRRIALEIIESIRDQARIEDVIGERIGLRRSGRTLVGSCPWHASRSKRSFVVYPEQKSWRCWGCAVGGDVFDFMERFAGMSFPEAVRLVGKSVGIEVDGNASEDAHERLSALTELRRVEKRIDEILESEFVRVSRDLDRITRLDTRAGDRLTELSAGAESRFPNEIELCWAALQSTAAHLPRLDAEYALVAFGKAADRENFSMTGRQDRERIIDTILMEGSVRDERGSAFEVPI